MARQISLRSFTVYNFFIYISKSTFKSSDSILSSAEDRLRGFSPFSRRCRI